MNVYITYLIITFESTHNELTQAIHHITQDGIVLEDFELTHEWEA